MKKRVGSVISAALFMLMVVVMSTTLVFASGTKLKITKQPESASALVGYQVRVSVTAKGDGLTYKWYDKDTDEKKFTQNKSFKGSSYSVKMSNAVHGRKVYCVIKDKNGKSVTTKTVTLKKGTKVKITKQPKSVSAPKDLKAKVTVTAKGDGLTYKWYYKDAGASKYTYTKTYKSKTYTVKMNKKRDGRKVYCVVTDKYGNSVRTETVTLTLGNTLKITKQPKSASVDCGKKLKVTVKAKGDGLTYKWYYKEAGASKYKLTKSYKTKTYSVKMNGSRDGRKIYCVITDKYGQSVKTKTVTLSTKHDFDKGKVTKKATCKVEGAKVYTCKKCSFKRTEALEKTSHKMGSWKVYRAATVTQEGVERRYCKNCSYYKDRSTAKLKAVYYITLKTGVGSATKVGVASDGKYSLSNPVRTGYNFKGWKTDKGESFNSSGTYKGNITLNAVWELDGTNTLDELVQRTDAGVDRILITANITVNKPLYISYKTKIYSDGNYAITRAADYAGDIFVVGYDRNGKTASVNLRKAELTLGGGKGTLTIDGNKANLKTKVLGSAVIISKSSILNVYDGVKITNHKKSGNDRIFDVDTSSVETLERAGGAAIINLNSTVNMYGGIIENNEVSTAYTVINNSDGTKTSKETNGCGGAVYNRGNFKMYGGTIKGNEGLRGGGIYTDRVVYLDAGNISDNVAYAFGGGLASSSSANADTFIGTENGSKKMVFSGNHCKGTGGALYSNTSSPIIIYGNARFESNSTDSSGGAIYTAGPLTIRNTEFIGNTSARSGGAIYHYYTKATFERRDMTVTDSKFEKNSGNLGGAIILSASDSVTETGLGTYATITNCQFNQNSAVMAGDSTGSGGAIYITRKSEAIIEKCSFTGNASVSNAGAVAAQGGTKVNLTDSTFTGNSAVVGGGLYASGAAWVKMQNIQFRDNSAVLNKSKSGGNGGAAYIYDTDVTFDNLDFYDNSAENHAGAVYLGVTDINIDSTCDFVGNSAGKHGGAFYLTYKTNKDGTRDGAVLNATDVKFEKNTAMAGGAISARTDCTANLTGVKLIGNSVTGYDNKNDGDGEGGGAVYVGYGALSLNNVTATGNSSYSNGGAVNAVKSDVSVKNVNFADNSSESNGGALFVSSEKAIETSDITFTGNAANNGGALYVGGNAVIGLENVAFSGNTAKTNGGGIYVFDSKVTINNVDMTGNSAGNNAGAFYLGATELNVDSACDFVGNSAGKHGGVFYLTYKTNKDETRTGAVLNAVNVNFENNTAMAGGAISARTNCTVNLNDTRLIGNSVSGYDDPKGEGEKVNDGDSEGGGAIYVGYGSATLNNVTATGNTASDFGGVIDAVGSDVTVIGGTYSGNKTYSGGVIFARSKSDVTVSGAVMSENESAYIQKDPYNSAIGGGAICTNGGMLKISDTSLTSNKSGYYGGAVHTTGTTVDISGNTVVTGSIGATGAALYFRGSSKVTMNGTAVTNNTSSGNGVIYHNGGTLDITGLTATGNKALNGGVFYISGGSTNATIEKSTFSGNNGSTGGVIHMTDATVTVSGSELKENTAKLAGAVYNRTGIYNSDGVSYSANTASNNGGAVSLAGGTANISETDSFTANSAAGYGGAIYVSYYDTTTIVDNIETEERLPGILVANGGTFTGNTALAGGAISARTDSDVSLTGTVLTNNTATSAEKTEGGGAIFGNNNTITLSGVVMEGNSTGFYGGAVTGLGAKVTVKDKCQIRNNKGITGVAFNLRDNGEDISECTITDVSVTDNKALDAGSGVIYITGKGTLEITNLTATGNENNNGGVIYASGSTNVTVADSVLSGNAALSNGGAIYVSDATVTVSNSEIKENTAKNGGAIYNIKGTYNSDDVSYSANIASGNGGVISIAGGTVNTGAEDTFISNSAVGHGGAVYVAYYDLKNADGSTTRMSGVLNANGGTFTGNTALAGGAISVRSDSVAELNGTELIGNSVEGYQVDSKGEGKNDGDGEGGGAIYVGFGTVKLTNVTATGNTASDFGGVLDSMSSTVDINGGSFSENSTKNGGALYLMKNSVVNIKGADFENNTATSKGGAISTDTSSANLAINVEDCAFEGNKATGAGAGAVEIQNGNSNSATDPTEVKIVFKNCSFIGNSAKTTGGAVEIRTSSCARFDGITATDNKSKDNGGVIYVTSNYSRLYLTGEVVLSGNDSEKSGDFIYLYNNNYTNPPKIYTTYSSSADWYALVGGNRTNVAFDLATLP